MSDQIEMPRYKCHKEVHAFKIQQIEATDSGGAIIRGEGNEYNSSRKYVDKHTPEVGGYFVVYEDGYTSFSPAEAFEAGYTALGVSFSSETDERADNTMRHNYRKLSLEERQLMITLKDHGLSFRELILTIELEHGPSRELALAKTKIEEAVMWAVKHVTS